MQIGGNVSVRAVSGTLHTAELEASLKPNAAALFNSGIGTLILPLVEGWVPTALRLLALDVPILCTCFHDKEANGEEMLLGKALKARTLVPSTANPFAHSTPLEVMTAAGAKGSSYERRAAELADEAEAEVASGEQNRSNTFASWVRGSSYTQEDLLEGGEAQQVAMELLKNSARLMAMKNMDGWVKGLESRNGRETVACNAELLAEATKEDSIALLALKNGAYPALQAVLMHWTPLVGQQRGSRSSGVGGGDSKDEDTALTYAGQRPEDRIVRGAWTAINNIKRAAAAAKALENVPDGAFVPFAAGAAVEYKNIFRGAYINLRAQPSVASDVVAQLQPGALVSADGKHGEWLRVQLRPKAESGAARYAWALLRHPVHGDLLEQQ